MRPSIREGGSETTPLHNRNDLWDSRLNGAQLEYACRENTLVISCLGFERDCVEPL